MHLISLLPFILYLLYDEFPLTAAPANISYKVASYPPAFGSIRSMKDKYSRFTTTTTTTNTTTSTIFTTSPVLHTDLLCNNNSEFVCVCQRNAGNLLKHYILCSQLIEVFLILNFRI